MIINPYIFLKENHSPEYQLILDTAKSLSFSVPKKKERIAQNMFVVSLITSGVWSKLDELYLFAHSANVDFCRINFIHPELVLTHLHTVFSKSKEGYHFQTGTHFRSSMNKETDVRSKFKLGNASFISSYAFDQSLVSDGSVYITRTVGSDFGSNEATIRETGYRNYFQQGGGYTHRGTSVMRVKPYELRVTARTETRIQGYYNNNLRFDSSITYSGNGASGTSVNVNYTLDFVSGGSSNEKIIMLAGTGEYLDAVDVENFTNAWNQYLTDIEII